MDPKEYVKGMVEKSRKAQKELESFSQEQIDELVRMTAKVVYDHAEELARMAVDETGMGRYDDKVAKNKGKSKTIWNSMKGVITVGIIERDEENGIVKIAKPIGVVASVTPTTNPIVTPMSNIMFAIKCQNSIIVSPHPRSRRCSAYTVKLINEAFKELNAPENLVQVIEEPTIELSSELMQAADVVVATGGAGMVKAAYSSGKPAYGVGPGNVQVIVDRDVDFADAAQKIIAGRLFDYGIICSGEQSVIVHEDDLEAVLNEFEKRKCVVFERPEEKDALRKALFPQGSMNGKLVGQPAYTVAIEAGIDVPEDTQVLLVKTDGMGGEDPLCKEKMCPVISVFSYKTFEDAVKIAQINLEFEGKGHTAGVYSNTKEHIEYAGLNLTVSRLVVNQPTSTTAGGSLYNGFAPSTTLGCGTWGNNSISENFTFKHMMNISRIGYFMADKKVPTDEEIWG